MQLTKQQFDLLYNGLKKDNIDKEYKNNNLKELKEKKLIDNENLVTEKGIEVLEPYKVKNAIILAAGLSSRFAPLSYEKPKGLAVVKGEVLIERLIKQLKDAGIEEIVIVLGHMIEKFVYLKNKFNVKLVVNNDYKTRNTYSSIFAARDFLNNSYICCADNYYPNNPFNSYEYYSYTTALYINGIDEGERGIFTDKNGLIYDTRRPAENQYVMLGFQYFDKEFCKKFKPIIEKYYYTKGTEKMYWERVFAENVEDLKMYERRFEWSDILEFDKVEELARYDPNYLTYNNYSFVKNICEVLECKPNEISNLEVITNGLTNKTFSFTVNEEKYVYRMPGIDIADEIDRKFETQNQEYAKRLNIDDSFLYEDPILGWKISKFVERDEEFSFNNEKHINLLCNLLRKLNNAHIKTGKEFNYINKIEDMLIKIKNCNLEKYNELIGYFQEVKEINKELKNDNWDFQLSHNDIWEDNLLLSKDKLYLIDWEYAGDTDIGFDISKLCVRSGCRIEELPQYLKMYYKRIPTQKEIDHLIRCVVVSYYYWYVWASYMILKGNNYEEYLERYQKIFIKYLNANREKKGGI